MMLEDSNEMVKVSSCEDFESVRSTTSLTGTSSQQGGGRWLHHSKKTSLITVKGAKHVAQSKLLFLMIMIVTAIGAVFATIKYSREEQYQEFEDDFSEYANEIQAISRDNAIGTFGVLASLSVTLTSFAKNDRTDWPFITVPDFEHRGSDYIMTAGAESVAFCPLVKPTDKDAWSEYSVQHQDWVQTGLDFDHKAKKRSNDNNNNETAMPIPKPIPGYIWKFPEASRLPIPDTSTWDDSLPLWQVYPAPHDTGVVNYNLMSNKAFEIGLVFSRRSGKVVISRTLKEVKAFGATNSNSTSPKNLIIQPIFEDFEEDAAVAGFLLVVLPWDLYLKNVLGEGSKPVICVVKNSCGDVFTFRLDGPTATFLGYDDFHDSRYESSRVLTAFPDFSNAPKMDESFDTTCHHSLEIYPTFEFENCFRSLLPYAYGVAVFMGFILISMVFVIYDLFVQKRQREVEEQATRTTAIVNQLFPEEVHARLYASVETGATRRGSMGSKKAILSNFLNLQSDGENEIGAEGNVSFPGQVYTTKPIADFFPDCTVSFADVTGFTAWSSIREPTQVFTLLECIYASFDKIARKNKVFKVETVGDCYVAVCGLPTAREDHAIVMARFAHNCRLSMKKLVHELEVTLGPDTSDLSMRFGLHSGPVTAGVLRGEKARFQLFGDTVNTASRMETTCSRNEIQCSETTALLLIAGGRGHWIKKREEKIYAKGKGEMQTYWFRPNEDSQYSEATTNCSSFALSDDNDENLKIHNNNNSVESNANRCNGSKLYDLNGKSDHSISKEEENASAKCQRLLDWNKERLMEPLKHVIEQRYASQANDDGTTTARPPAVLHSIYDSDSRKTVLDEVQEIITLPKFNYKNHRKVSNIEIPETVVTQLRDYIETLASLYHENPFHNFEHASHVVQSTGKLLSRIVAPEVEAEENEYYSVVHDHTYGITSDPLTQFAVIFSGLIHDVDHPGVPNTVLVKEKSELAALYNDKSVAEQNSVDIAWNLLMDEAFDELRSHIYQTEDEMKRFRQLIVNCVMATDIADKTLGALRKARWNKAFNANGNSSSTAEKSSPEDDVNRKATIVIEHLIQASDVSHTMQHWEVFIKWNERLFHEMYLAYIRGRIDSNPIDTWYKGEIGFFDFYIIPLAKNLKDCGVFGVSSDEYLNYATENRHLWEEMGQEIVAKYRRKYVEIKTTVITEHGKLPIEDGDKVAIC